MTYLNKLEVRKRAQIDATRQAEIELLSSLEEGDEVRFPKELAHQIQPLAALAHEIGKPVRVQGLAIIRDGHAQLPGGVLVSEFLADECEVGAELRARTTELYDRFAEYCAQRRQAAMSRVAFGRQITARGFQYRERSQPEYYSYRLGLRLKTEQNPQIEGREE